MPTTAWRSSSRLGHAAGALFTCLLVVYSLICLLLSQRCFNLMDRGFVFKQINNYMSCFTPGDPKVDQWWHTSCSEHAVVSQSSAFFFFLIQTLFEFKFEFLRVVCNHEHYVPLNLPMPFGKGRILRFQGERISLDLREAVHTADNSNETKWIPCQSSSFYCNLCL